MKRCNFSHVVLLIVIGVLSTVLLLKKQNNQYPLSVDDRGRVIDPYLQREVKNTITANARDVQVCFNSHVASRDNNSKPAGGLLFVDWMVSASGTVKNPRIIFSEFVSDSKFESCVLKSLAGWQFPAPGYSRYAEHRFQFNQANQNPASETLAPATPGPATK